MSSSPPSDFGSDLNRKLEQQVSFADAKLSALIGSSTALGSLLLAEKPSFPRSFVPNPFEPLQALLAYVAPVTYSLAHIIIQIPPI